MALVGLGVFAALIVPFIVLAGRRVRRRPEAAAKMIDSRPGFAGSRKLIKTSLVGDRLRWLAIGEAGAILCGGDGIADVMFSPGEVSLVEVTAGQAVVARAGRDPASLRAEDPAPAWKEIREVSLRLSGAAGAVEMGFKTFEHGAPSLPEFMMQEAMEWFHAVTSAQALAR